MIEARHLSKRYGGTLAVDDLSFSVGAGQVTGFLGPNGSGKSTTMRMIVSLDRPTSGSVMVSGRAYGSIRFPLHEVGALLDANAAHPGRRARNHLNWLAESNKIPRSRVDEVLEIVGLTEAAHRRAGELSLGMGQRLGIAAALLGDPAVLILDEPINGLDPEGILWVRHLLRSLADEGRTVLVSSHLMSEMALTADHLIVIGRGSLLSSGPVAEFIERSGGHHVKVVTPDAEAKFRGRRLAWLPTTCSETLTVDVKSNYSDSTSHTETIIFGTNATAEMAPVGFARLVKGGVTITSFEVSVVSSIDNSAASVSVTVNATNGL